MGKGSSENKGKSAQRKAARQAELLAEKQRKEVIAAANALGDPLDMVKAFVAAAGAKHGVTLECGPADSAAAADQEFCFDLLKSNMMEKNIAAGFGWNDAQQKATLAEEGSWLVMIRKEAPKPAEGAEAEAGERVGFALFRFTLEGDCPVLYVYEVQASRAASAEASRAAGCLRRMCVRAVGRGRAREGPRQADHAGPGARGGEDEHEVYHGDRL